MLIFYFRRAIRLNESETKLASDNQKFWAKDYSDPGLAQNAHWKGNGIFEDQNRWLSIGKEHLDLILNYASVTNLKFPVKQIVEWGCGGGANAVHFAPLTEKFIGVDITSESLTECKNQVLEYGYKNFQPELIDAQTPELILKKQIVDVDLLISTYVFEQFPSPSYGLRILKIVNKLLKNSGIAFIHIRYNDGKNGYKSKGWGYKWHTFYMTTYSLEEFWEYSKEYGFEPLGIYLTPQQPLVSDKSTAYFFLRKLNDI